MQYRSAIFYRTDLERSAALGAIERASVFLGPIRTAVEPIGTFWRAEDYHQKYRLRAETDLMREFHLLYPTEREFVDSTAAARVNGWLYGYGDRAQIERELPLIGLSESGQTEIRRQTVAAEGAVAR
jgi:peptide-methionine (S)-S-oxide reductase